LNNSVFWDTMSCSPLNVNRRIVSPPSSGWKSEPRKTAASNALTLTSPRLHGLLSHHCCESLKSRPCGTTCLRSGASRFPRFAILCGYLVGLLGCGICLRQFLCLYTSLSLLGFDPKISVFYRYRTLCTFISHGHCDRHVTTIKVYCCRNVYYCASTSTP
jgi:hypothetical protein